MLLTVLKGDVEEPAKREATDEEAAFEASPVATLHLDREGAILRANPAAGDLLGVEAGDLRGSPLSAVVAPDGPDAGAVQRAVEATCSPDDPGESRTVDATVGDRPVELRLRSADGETVAAVAVLLDRADRERRRTRLDRYETVVGALPDAVYATNSSGYITYANPAFESVTGYAVDEVEDLHFSDLLDDEDTRAMQRALRETIDTGDTDPRTFDVTAITRHGSQRPMQNTFVPLPSPGEFRGIVGVLRDVSDRRRRQEVLTVLNRALRHNLRTHVTTISGYLDAVAVDEETAEYADRIRNSAEWIGKLGETLRDLQQAVQQDRDEETIGDLGELVDHLVEEYRVEYPDAEFDVEITDDVGVSAGNAIWYALENVVENAVVHNDRRTPHVEIWVTDAPDEGRFDVIVADDGPGIPEQERSLIVDDAEISPLQHGSGLGLWIARWIVEIFDGSLHIADNDPRGTIVTLRLPRASG